jgi:hypothetical protein
MIFTVVKIQCLSGRTCILTNRDVIFIRDIQRELEKYGVRWECVYKGNKISFKLDLNFLKAYHSPYET